LLSLEILSSSFAAAAYFLQNPLPDGKKVYVVGEGGIGEELDLIGIPHLGGLVDKDKVVTLGPGIKMEHDHNVGAVVAGYDRYINYYKIQYAQLCLNQNKDCKFIATNLDGLSHMTDAQEWAAGGTMVGAIRGCTGKEPIVVGKPSSLLIDHILQTRPQLQRNRIVMVGDRLDTDVLFGSRNGLKTLLVLSGVTSEQTLFSPSNEIIPDYYANTVADLFAK
jgi:phosphoglycolate/pyridoxal phosphate phosphatase family enzyme